MLDKLPSVCLRDLAQSLADADRDNRTIGRSDDDPLRYDVDRLTDDDRVRVLFFVDGARYERSRRADRYPELPLRVFAKTAKLDDDDDDGLDLRALVIMAIVTVAFLLCGNWVYQRSVRTENRANAQLAQIQRERDHAR